MIPAPPAERTAAPKRRAGRAFPAFVLAVAGAVLVVALPFVARHVDGSADEFSSDTVPIFPALGWLVCAVLGAIVITHAVQRRFRLDAGPVLAIAYDMLPVVLFLAPVVTLAAGLTGHLLLAGAAAALTAYQAVLVVPRLLSKRPPRWSRDAPRLRVVVANVYVDNETPESAARQLVHCDADVIVIAEATPAFMRVFDEQGGARSHPHRVSDPQDTGDYAVAIASRLPLGVSSSIRDEGPLRLAIAVVEVGGIATTVAGLNPRATFDPQGQEIWKQQMEELANFVPTVDGPLVVAGDMNSTQFRPEFEALLQVGLDDAIDSLGQAWKPSFSLRSVGRVGALGVVARLDQALVNDRVAALHVHNLKPCGSDHLPFRITLAVR